MEFLNVFDCMKKTGNCKAWEPRPTTGEPMPPDLDRGSRVIILAARIKRGENLFFESEKSLESMIPRWEPVLNEYGKFKTVCHPVTRRNGK